VALDPTQTDPTQTDPTQPGPIQTEPSQTDLGGLDRRIRDVFSRKRQQDTADADARVGDLSRRIRDMARAANAAAANAAATPQTIRSQLKAHATPQASHPGQGLAPPVVREAPALAGTEVTPDAEPLYAGQPGTWESLGAEPLKADEGKPGLFTPEARHEMAESVRRGDVKELQGIAMQLRKLDDDQKARETAARQAGVEGEPQFTGDFVLSGGNVTERSLLIKRRTEIEGRIATKSLEPKGFQEVTRAAFMRGEWIPFYAGAPKLVRAIEILNAVTSVKKGEMSRDDVALLLEYDRELRQETNFSTGVAELLVQLPAFAGEIASTGGAYTAGRVVTKKAIYAAVRKAVARFASKATAGKAGTAAAVKGASSLAGGSRLALRLGQAGGIVGGTLYRLPFFPHHVALNTVRNMTGKSIRLSDKEGEQFNLAVHEDGDNFLKALVKGTGSTVVELWSEMAGKGIAIAGKMIPGAKVGLLKLRAMKAALMTRYLQKVPGARMEKLFDELRTKGAWHGPLGEIGEEELGKLVSYAVQLDEKYEFTSLEQFFQMYVAFLVPGAARAVVGAPVRVGKAIEGAKEEERRWAAKRTDPTVAQEPHEMTADQFKAAPTLPTPAEGKTIVYHELKEEGELDSALESGLQTPRFWRKAKAGEGPKGVIVGTTDPSSYSGQGVVIGVEVPNSQVTAVEGEGVHITRDVAADQIVYVDRLASSSASDSTAGPLSSERVSEHASEHHRAYVEDALAKGKPVPAEVLADYPDLAAPLAVEAEDVAAAEAARGAQASLLGIDEAVERGRIDEAAATVARYLLTEVDPDFDLNSTLEISAAIAVATAEAEEKGGYVRAPGEVAAARIAGETVSSGQGDQVRTAVSLYKGHDADTVVEEWYHRAYDRLGANDRAAYQEYHDNSGDARPVNEHFAQEGKNFFFTKKLYSGAASFRPVFERIQEALLGIARKIGGIKGANVPEAIEKLYRTAGEPRAAMPVAKPSPGQAASTAAVREAAPPVTPTGPTAEAPSPTDVRAPTPPDAERRSYQIRPAAVTPEQDRRYMAAVKAGNTKAAQKLVDAAAKKASALTFDSEGGPSSDATAYSARRKSPPDNTEKRYKAFRVVGGHLRSLYATSEDNVPMGVWLDAKEGGEPFEVEGRKYIKGRGMDRLAYRPGWHTGTLPYNPQGAGRIDERYDKKNPTPAHPYRHVLYKNIVIAEVEIAADKNYQKEYEEDAVRVKGGPRKGEINENLSGLRYVPKDGYYDYATSETARATPGNWSISGSMKINRLLTHEQASKILSGKGVMPQLRVDGGEFVNDNVGTATEASDASRFKLRDPITRDDAGKVIPLSQRFDPTKESISYQIRPGEVTPELGTGKQVFNFTVMSDKIDIIRDMAGRGDIAGLQEANRAVVRHALADVPPKSYKVEVEDVQGVWEGTTEPAVAVKVEAKSEGALNAIRSRMSALGAMFDQDEVHEIELDVDVPGNIGLGGRAGFDHYQPYAIITLDRGASWSEVEDARVKSGIMGASFDGVNILVYNTHETPQVFAKRVLALLGAINDAGRIRPSVKRGTARIRRNGRTHSTKEGVIGYAEGSVLDGESSPLATDLALRILRHTGGRLTAPTARSLFTREGLTPRQIATQREIADDYEAAPDNDLSNPIVQKSYDALNVALVEQWYDIIDGNIRIEFVPWKRTEGGKVVEKEPYPNSRAVVKDIRQNRNLRVLLTTPEAFGPEGIDFSGHPLLEQSGISGQVMDENGKFSEQEVTYNDVLRAVHDAIAHGLYADSFGPIGEEGAWRAHVATIADPWARWAITTETRAQNSWINYGPPVRDATGGIEFDAGAPGHVPIKERGFASQKAILLPIKHILTGNKAVDAPTQQLIESLDANEKRGSLLPERQMRHADAPVAERRSYQIRPGEDAGRHAAVAEGILSLGEEGVLREEIKIYPEARTNEDRESKRILAYDASRYMEDEYVALGFEPMPKPNEKLTDKQMGILATRLAKEARLAEKESSDAIGWYFDKVYEALQTMSEFLPGLMVKSEKQFIFKVSLAITSDGEKVVENFRKAVRVFGGWNKDAKKRPLKVSSHRSGVNKNLALVGALVKKYGWESVDRFFAKTYTVRQLKEAGFDVTGEAVTETVYGASILGPKIGSFYSNLSGRFDTLTMDLWWTRTMGRLMGVLTLHNERLVKENMKDMRGLLSTEYLKEFKFDKKEVEDSDEVALQYAVKLKAHNGTIFTKYSTSSLKESLEDGKEYLGVANVEASTKEITEPTSQASLKDLMDWNEARPANTGVVITNAMIVQAVLTQQTEQNRVKTDEFKKAKRVYANSFGLYNAPGGSTDRTQQRKVAQRAIEIFNKGRAVKITTADFQALLWYHEKRIWNGLHVSGNEGDIDYATAAKQVGEEIRRGHSKKKEDGPTLKIPGLPKRTRTSRRLEQEKSDRSGAPGGGLFDQADVERGRKKEAVEEKVEGAFPEAPGILVHPDVVKLYQRKNVGWDPAKLTQKDIELFKKTGKFETKAKRGKGPTIAKKKATAPAKPQKPGPETRTSYQIKPGDPIEVEMAQVARWGAAQILESGKSFEPWLKAMRDQWGVEFMKGNARRLWYQANMMANVEPRRWKRPKDVIEYVAGLKKEGEVALTPREALAYALKHEAKGARTAHRAGQAATAKATRAGEKETAKATRIGKQETTKAVRAGEKAAKKAYRAGQLDLLAAHQELFEFAKEHLPIEEQRKIIPAISGARTQKQLANVIVATNRILANYEKRSAIEEFEKAKGRIRKKGLKILPQYKKKIFEILDSIAGSTPGGGVIKSMESLEKFLKNEEDPDVPYSTVAKMLSVLKIEAGETKLLRQMEAGDIRAITATLEHLLHQNAMMGKMLGRRKAEKAEDLLAKIMDEAAARNKEILRNRSAGAIREEAAAPKQGNAKWAVISAQLSMDTKLNAVFGRVNESGVPTEAYKLFFEDLQAGDRKFMRLRFRFEDALKAALKSVRYKTGRLLKDGLPEIVTEAVTTEELDEWSEPFTAKRKKPLGKAKRVTIELPSAYEDIAVTTKDGQIRSTRQMRLRRQPLPSIEMSVGEMINLYAQWQDPDTRYQLTRNNSGGIVFARLATQDTLRPAILRAADVKAIIAKMTPKQKAVGDILVEFVNGDLATEFDKEWISQKGFSIVNPGRTYYPRSRGAEFVKADRDPSIQMKDAVSMRLDQQGIMKERTGGTQPIVVNDAFAHITGYVNQVTAFMGKSEPANNALKLLGNPNLRGMLFERMKWPNEFIEDLKNRIITYRGMDVGQNEKFESWARGLMTRFHVGALGARLHIVLYQVPSYMLAMTVIKAKHLAHKPVAMTKARRQEMSEASSELRTRIEGRSAQIMTPYQIGSTVRNFWTGEDETWDRVNNVILKPIHAADMFVIANIWEAAKLEGQDQGLTGEKLIEHAARRTETTISRTQPSWDLLSAPQMAVEGRKDLGQRMLTLFSSQTGKLVNMAANAVIDYTHIEKGKRTAADRAKLAVGVAVPLFIQSALIEFIYRGVTSLLRAGIPDREKETWFWKIWQVAKRSVSMFRGYGTGLEAIMSVAEWTVRKSAGVAQSRVRGLPLGELAKDVLESVSEITEAIDEAAHDERYTEPWRAGKSKAVESLWQASRPVTQIVGFFGVPVAGVMQLLQRWTRPRTVQYYSAMLRDAVKWDDNERLQHAMDSLEELGVSIDSIDKRVDRAEEKRARGE